MAFEVVGGNGPALRAHQREELVSDGWRDLPNGRAILYRKISGEDRAGQIVERLEEARELYRQREARRGVQGDQEGAPQWLARQPRITDEGCPHCPRCQVVIRWVGSR